MTAVCRSCGGPLSEGRIAGICPKCSFSGALGLGSSDSGGSRDIDGYELLQELGRGAMGVVWLARERMLDRLVALKQIAVSDPMLRKRLLREGQAVARLRHPNIVAIHSMGGDDAATFLAMEFIEGGNLEMHLQGKPMPPREAAQIALRIAGALEHAHAAGLLHRDVKPSNILMGLEGEPKLADFGMAAPLEGSGDLTAPGTIAGTPAYLAPELVHGSEGAQAASDIYSLGAVLYTCLAGRPPFIGQSAAAILAQLPEADPLPPRLFQPGVPQDLETICLKCLEKNPERRYASAANLGADLAAFLSGEPISARPVGRVERLARYCRRRPALVISTGVAALLLLTLAVGGPLAAIKLARSERAAVDARTQAERANAAMLERLRESLLARSRAIRLAAGLGQRDDALASATEAARIRTGLDARDEVIAALARPEIEQVSEFSITRVADSAISFDPNHDRYAIEVSAGQIELRSLSDNRLIQALSGPKERAWSRLIFSPDGKWISFRNGSGMELVWNEKMPAPAFVLEDRPYVLKGRYSYYGRPGAFSPDGSTFVSSLPGGGISFHATSDGHELRRITTEAEVTHLAYSGDGRWLAVGHGLGGASGEKAMYLKVLGALDGRIACELPIDETFQTVVWGRDSDQLLLSGDEIQLFAVPSGRRVRRLVEPLATEAFFGPEGTAISATSGGLVTLWDLGRAKPLLSTALGSQSAIGVNGDGTLIAKEVGNGAMRLYSLETPRVVHTLPIASPAMRDNVFSSAVSVIDYSPDGRWIATAVWGAIQLRDSSGHVVSVFHEGSASNYCSVRFSRDGRSLLSSGYERGLVGLPILTSPTGNAQLGNPVTIDKEQGYFLTDISRDGKRVLLTSIFKGSCKVISLDGSTTQVAWDLPGAAGAAFLNDDRDVLANSLEDERGAPLEIRDSTTGARGRVLNFKHGAHVNVSTDGKSVLFGVGDAKTILLRIPDWSAGPDLPAEVQGRGTQAAFSPDGGLIAFGVGDAAVLVRTADGSVVAHLHSPQGGTYLPGLVFSPDGSRLALWWENGQLTLWNVRGLRAELAARGLDW
jgi:WD40 repeat protein